jgi:hypothetical protein
MKRYIIISLLCTLSFLVKLESIEPPPTEILTAQDGNWAVAGTWIGNQVPTAGQIAVLRHVITLNTEQNIFSYRYEAINGVYGTLAFQAGGKLNTGL